MNSNRRNAIKAMLALGVGLAGLQPYKQVVALSTEGPITIYVGFPPGGIPDYIMRVLALELEKELKRTVLIINRTGAGGQLSVIAAKNAKPDGLSYSLVTPAMLSLYPSVYSNMGYNAKEDVQPVATICSYYSALAVNSDMPVQNLAEFLEWCKANPAHALCGAPAIGGTMHFAIEQLKKASGAPLEVLAYRGGPALTQAVLSNEIASSLNMSYNFAPLYKEKRLKILAISSQERIDDIPDVPTFSESGFADVVLPEWLGLVTSSKVSSHDVQQMNQAVNNALLNVNLQEAMKRQHCYAKTMSVEELNTLVGETTAYWEGYIKETGFKLQS